MNKTISFVEEDSERLGHLIVNHKFDQFEITKESGKLIRTLKGPTELVHCIEQIDDFSKIVTCSIDFTIKIWSTESGECLKTLTGHSHCVGKLLISNDKKHLISGSLDECVKIWDIENDFECVQTLKQEHFVSSLCILPSNILVCGLGNGKITKYNKNLDSFTKIDSFKAHESGVWGLKHFSSSQIVSGSCDGKIKVWDLETNECLRTFSSNTEPIEFLEISLDRSKLYSGSVINDFGLLKVWDISSGECLKTIVLSYNIGCFKLLSSNFLAIGFIRDHYTHKENFELIDLRSYERVKSFKLERRYVRSLNFDSERNVLFLNASVDHNPGEIEIRQF
jgi:WD40 repeat protein